VPVLFVTHEAYLDHLTSAHHPERPARLAAVIAGAKEASVADGLVALAPEPASRQALERVHPGPYLDNLLAIHERGGGRLDPDTVMSSGSWDAAVLAAGAGLTAVEALQQGVGGASAAFCAVRPPGHHATPVESMGFCILSNVAVVAAALADQGERVLIVDYDAHHGNGTQACFYEDPRVLYVSLHQWPLYPGTGRHDELGDGDGYGSTLNIPVPPGATGDVYLAAVDDLIAPLVQRFEPTWLIISAGFDAHAADPITELGLSSGDYGLVTRRLLEFVPPGRRLVMLEGGYDLEALQHSSAATIAELLDREHHPEAPTTGGPGRGVIERIRGFRYELGLL
jgi:acetoin utilization deacetylase AcuC-like enzyme